MSNGLVQELQRLSEKKVVQKCPTCGKREIRRIHADSFQEALVRFLKENRTIRMDSCIVCVEKHITRASGYFDELLSSSNSGKADGTASINAYKAYLKCLQHLGLAIEESEEYETLHSLLLSAERELRYEGIEPNWESITKEMYAIKTKQ